VSGARRTDVKVKHGVILLSFSPEMSFGQKRDYEKGFIKYLFQIIAKSAETADFRLIF
jgi:hypothetical protein